METTENMTDYSPQSKKRKMDNDSSLSNITFSSSSPLSVPLSTHSSNECCRWYIFPPPSSSPSLYNTNVPPPSCERKNHRRHNNNRPLPTVGDHVRYQYVSSLLSSSLSSLGHKKDKCVTRHVRARRAVIISLFASSNDDIKAGNDNGNNNDKVQKNKTEMMAKIRFLKNEKENSKDESDDDDDEEEEVIVSIQKCLQIVYRRSGLKNNDGEREDSNNSNHEKNGCTFIVTSTTKNYRYLASTQVNPNDRVLEIGCSTGQCSIKLASSLGSGGTLTCFDISKSMVKQAKERFLSYYNPSSSLSPSSCKTTFYVCDPIMDPLGAVRLSTTTTTTTTTTPTTPNKLIPLLPNVIFIDIGGNRELKGLSNIIDFVEKYLSPTLVVVKSQAIVHLAMDLRMKMMVPNNDNLDSTTKDGKLCSRDDHNHNVKNYVTCNASVDVDGDGDNRIDYSLPRLGDDGLIIGAGSNFLEKYLNKAKQRQQQQHSGKAGGTLLSECESKLQGNCNNERITTIGTTTTTAVVTTATDFLRLLPPPRYNHPLRAPLAVVPLSMSGNEIEDESLITSSLRNNNNNNNNNNIPICRYHNYHKEGCRKGDDECPYNHHYCHWCLIKGHVALNCPGRSRSNLITNIATTSSQ